MPKRRSTGEGSLYRRKDGRWCGSAFTRSADGKRTRAYVYASTQKQAREDLRAMLARSRRQVAEPDRRRTVGAYLSNWATSREVRPRTRDSYEWIVGKHIVPDLGADRRLVDVSVGDVRSLLARKRREGLSPTTRRYVLRILRMALEQAVRDQVLEFNPATRVEMPRAEQFEVDPLTLEETRRFLSGIRGDRFEAFYLLAVHRGLRLGELLALRWSDLRLDGDATVRVLHTLERIPAARRDPGHQDLGWRLSPVKSRPSRRTLPLPPRVVDAVRAHRAQQAEERLLLGPARTDHGLVFAASTGEPLDASNIRRTFKATLKRLGLRPVRIHDLRHGAATLLLEQGENLKQVSAVLGHSRIGTTGDIYRHYVETLDRRAAERLETALLHPEEELVETQLLSKGDVKAVPA